MLHKSFELLETKADGETGTFEALVSAFGNVDSVGDRILPGAYTKTLERWRESGDPIPIILSHQWDNPMSHIGVADPKDVKQTPRGLMVKGKLDIADNDVAKQVYRLMKRRSLKEFSIGYRVPAGGEQAAKDGANDISEIDLVECGPTLKGANSEAQLQAVKSAIEQEKVPDLAETFLAAVTTGWEAVNTLSDEAKEDLATKAAEILGIDQKQAEETDKEPKARSVDPLRRAAREAVLDVQTAGRSPRKATKQKATPKAEPRPHKELRTEARRQMLAILSE